MSEVEAPPSDTPSVDEFAGLAPRRPARHPGIAIAALVLSGALIWHLRHDFFYALSAATPGELGNCSVAPGCDDKLANNRFVTLSGIPDRRNALVTEPRGDNSRQYFFRLHNSDGRVFVRAPYEVTRTDLADRWTGRLRRVSEVSYAASLTDYYAGKAKTRRYVATDALARALASAGALPATMPDRGGETFALAPGDEIAVDVRVADELFVRLPLDKFSQASDAAYELERAGAVVASPCTEQKKYFECVVSAPAGERDRLIPLVEARGWKVALREARFLVRWADLKGGADGIELPTAKQPPRYVRSPDGKKLIADEKPGRVPWAAVRGVSALRPISVSGDGYILSDGEKPGDLLWAVGVVAVALVFGGFNAAYLARLLRRKK